MSNVKGRTKKQVQFFRASSAFKKQFNKLKEVQLIFCFIDVQQYYESVLILVRSHNYKSQELFCLKSCRFIKEAYFALKV